MNRETRIIVQPTNSRLKRRKWLWQIERRNYGTSKGHPAQGIKATKVYGTWYEVAYGYSRNAVDAEQAARTWLDVEAMRVRDAEQKQRAEMDKVARFMEQRRVINIKEEN